MLSGLKQLSTTGAKCANCKLGTYICLLVSYTYLPTACLRYRIKFKLHRTIMKNGSFFSIYYYVGYHQHRRFPE